MSLQPFNDNSYLGQVRQLRGFAAEVLARYQIRVKRLKFIHHGENTTFRVEGANDQRYLLRIHRNDYHTKEAILEELRWLALLASRGLSVPKPVRSPDDDLVVTVESAHVRLTRNCCLFKWIDGHFVEKSLSTRHMFQVGEIIAELQQNTPNAPVKFRRYWTAEGLVGRRPKFGSIESLFGVHPRQQTIISEARKLVFSKLRKFELKYPERQSLIHADLHFGNVISVGRSLGAIDFDDCGYGFHAYDLAIPLISAEGMLGERSKKMLPHFKDALISGYTTRKSWDRFDESVFKYLITARRLLMLGWLNSRSDNPRLQQHLKGAVERTLKRLRDVHNLK